MQTFCLNCKNYNGNILPSPPPTHTNTKKMNVTNKNINKNQNVPIVWLINHYFTGTETQERYHCSWIFNKVNLIKAC